MESTDKTIANAKLLPPQEQLRIIDELSTTINVTANGLLDQLLPISNATLAVKGHSLEMCVIDTFGEEIPIYNHLALFKELLLREYSNNYRLIKALSDTSPLGLTQKIKKLKLHAPEISIKNNIFKNITDKIFLTGNQEGNEGCSTKSGVQDVTYSSNSVFKQDHPVGQIFEEIKGYGLSEVDAIRLFVVIAGLPKSGFQNSDGRRCNVGRCGYFAFSAVRRSSVSFLWFSDNFACFSSSSESDGMPSLIN